MEPRIRRREGREYTKANAAASKMTASNQRARAGGEMEVSTAANGAVVAAPWEEAAEEHVMFWWWDGGRWKVVVCRNTGLVER